MRDLAIYLNEDFNKWGIAGLIHDLDIELVNADIYKYTIETEKILISLDFPIDIFYVMKKVSNKIGFN